MKKDIEIDHSNDLSFEKKRKKRRFNVRAIGIGLVFIIAGLVWYAWEKNLIPHELIEQYAGPIIIGFYRSFNYHNNHNKISVN